VAVDNVYIGCCSCLHTSRRDEVGAPASLAAQLVGDAARLPFSAVLPHLKPPLFPQPREAIGHVRVSKQLLRRVLDLSLDGGLREGRWRLLGDFVHQAIYDDSVDLDGFCCDQGGGCAVFELDENCRNSPAVAALACAGGGIGGGYVRVMRADDGDLPEVRFWESSAHQHELLCAALEDLRVAGFKAPEVAILSTRNGTACVASTLTEQPWHDRLTPLARSGPHGPIVDLHSGKTRYATVHRFKGLESRAVVLTDIERLNTPRERDLFYIGATRATQRLIVLAHESLRGKLQ